MLCDTLVCGVVSDEEMIAAKGPNIMGIEERCALARSCKWVDEVILSIYNLDIFLIKINRYKFNFEYLVNFITLI